MVTTSYNLLGQVISAADANNTIVYNEYDMAHRLKVTRDKDRNVIKKYEYSDSLISNLPDWRALDSTYWRCEQDGNGDNTGNLLRKEIDSNYYSDSYLTYRMTLHRVDPVRCPTGTCTGEGKKRINYICEQGCRVVTASEYNGSSWECTYHYVWSDSSISEDYVEYGPFFCELGGCE